MTALYVHWELNKVHLTCSSYTHISKVENLAFVVDQHQLIGREHFVVVGVRDVSVWEPNAFNISPSQRQCGFSAMSEPFIYPLLTKINIHLKFLKIAKEEEEVIEVLTPHGVQYKRICSFYPSHGF